MDKLQAQLIRHNQQAPLQPASCGASSSTITKPGDTSRYRRSSNSLRQTRPRRSTDRLSILVKRAASMCLFFLLALSHISAHADTVVKPEIPDGYKSLVVVFSPNRKAPTFEVGAGSGVIVGPTPKRKHVIIVTNQHVTQGEKLVGIFVPKFKNRQVSASSFDQETIIDELKRFSCIRGLASSEQCRHGKYFRGTTTSHLLSRCTSHAVSTVRYTTSSTGRRVPQLEVLGRIELGRVIYEDSKYDFSLISSCVGHKSEGIKEIARCEDIMYGQELHLFGSTLDEFPQNQKELTFGLWRWIPGIFRACSNDTVSVASIGVPGRSGGPVLTRDGRLLGIHRSSNRMDMSYEVPAHHLLKPVNNVRMVRVVTIRNKTTTTAMLQHRCAKGLPWTDPTTLRPHKRKAIFCSTESNERDIRF